MRALLAAAILIGVCAGRVHAMTYDEKLASCLACHGEKGILETPEVPSLAGMPADFTPAVEGGGRFVCEHAERRHSPSFGAPRSGEPGIHNHDWFVASPAE